MARPSPGPQARQTPSSRIKTITSSQGEPVYVHRKKPYVEGEKASQPPPGSDTIRILIQLHRCNARYIRFIRAQHIPKLYRRVQRRGAPPRTHAGWVGGNQEALRATWNEWFICETKRLVSQFRSSCALRGSPLIWDPLRISDSDFRLRLRSA